MRLLTLSLILVTVSAAIGIGWVIDYVYLRQSQVESPTEHNHLLMLARQYAQAVATSPEPILRLKDDEVGVSLAELDQFPLPASLKPAFLAGEPLLLETQDGFSIHLYQTVPEQVVSFEFNQPLSSEAPTSQRLLLTLAFYLGVILFILIWSVPLIKRLLTIDKTIKRFGEGELGARISKSSFSYLKHIESGFNRMAQHINTLIEDNRLLSRAVSHDLRTPIARLRFGIDLLQEESLTKQQTAHLEHLSRDLDEMESLVETLLRYARMEQGKIELKPEKLQLDQLLRQLTEPYLDLCSFELDFTPLAIEVDKHYFSMLVNNLLGNAVRYANRQIKVRLVRLQGKVVLSFENDGAPLAEADYDKVIKPFYRADNSSKGHGMGLAIVSRIAEWHHGQLQLSPSESLGGLKVALVLHANMAH